MVIPTIPTISCPTISGLPGDRMERGYVPIKLATPNNPAQIAMETDAAVNGVVLSIRREGTLPNERVVWPVATRSWE